MSDDGSSAPVSKNTIFTSVVIHTGKVRMYRLLFVCLCVCWFVRLRISPLRIKLAVSNFSQQFVGIQGRE